MPAGIEGAARERGWKRGGATTSDVGDGSLPLAHMRGDRQSTVATWHPCGYHDARGSSVRFLRVGIGSGRMWLRVVTGDGEGGRGGGEEGGGKEIGMGEQTGSEKREGRKRKGKGEGGEG